MKDLNKSSEEAKCYLMETDEELMEWWKTDPMWMELHLKRAKPGEWRDALLRTRPSPDTPSASSDNDVPSMRDAIKSPNMHAFDMAVVERTIAMKKAFKELQQNKEETALSKNGLPVASPEEIERLTQDVMTRLQDPNEIKGMLNRPDIFGNNKQYRTETAQIQSIVRHASDTAFFDSLTQKMTETGFKENLCLPTQEPEQVHSPHRANGNTPEDID